MHKALSIMINSGSFLSHFYLKMEVVKIYFLDLVYFTFEIWVFKSETKRGYNTTTKYILRLKYGEKFYGKKLQTASGMVLLDFICILRNFADQASKSPHWQHFAQNCSLLWTY